MPISAAVLAVNTAACASASERDSGQTAPDSAPSSTTEPATTPDASAATTSTTLDPVRQLVFDVCMEPQRTTEAGIQLEVDLIYESREDERARIHRALSHAVMLAEQAADLDPSYSEFADAEAYWRDHGQVTAETIGDDPQLDAALATIHDVCETVGFPTGEPVNVPDGLYADTSERGRYEACKELIFGDDGSVYVNGQRFDYSDCDRITNAALEEVDHDSAFVRSVELFFDDVGGPICWGEECRDRFQFSPY